MSVDQMKAEIGQLLDQIDNERFLKALLAFVKTYVQENIDEPIVSYDIDGTPRTVSELTAILDAEVDAAKRGEYITIAAFKKQSIEWGQVTK